ncbi:pumilio homolog 3 isoform X2 [Pocillopora verrucosa]|uniref:pumilio homolog 3 isoform X2 n=1 Tax=Pocillopora verrucosa TaxID=203993 RepID=UPI00333F3F9C
MADAENQKRSRNFKKKFKGKGDDAKRKFKPKKFSKDFRGENSPGQKRKANDTNADGYRKKWKGEIGSQDGKKGYRRYDNNDKRFSVNGKGSRNSYVKGNFVGDKAMKRKLSDESDEKPNIWQMKKKERKDFRRQQDENYDLVHDLKKLYETIRRKKCSKAEKAELVEKILSLIAGHTHDVIFKHDTGRVIQACVKFGTVEQRQKLFEQFKGDFGELIKSKYSKFFIKKLLIYGTKKQRDVIIKCFYGQVRKLIRHKEASSILETIYSDYANSAQKAHLIQEFYGADFAFFKSSELNSLEKVLQSDPARKTGILKYMKDALLPLIDRSVIGHSIIHRVLLEYLTYADENARSEMIELIKDSVVLILHTHDGARVGMHCLWYGTVKDRKVLVKSFKSYYVKICKEEFGHLVLLALFDCVDDTVLVKKIMFSEIQPSLQELAVDTYGRKVLMYLLCPRSPSHFHPTTVELLKKGDGNSNSKKDSHQRQNELLEGISPALLDLIEKIAEELLFDKGGCQLVLAALLQCAGDVERAMMAIVNLANRDLDPSTEDEDHVVKSAAGHFALKRLINQDKGRLQSENKDEVLFSKLLLDNTDPRMLLDWCKVNRGAFVVASLLESSVPGVSDTVKSHLQPRVSKLKKHDSKGVQIVLKLLAN